MADDLTGAVLTVIGVLAGMAFLLFLMSALDPTTVRRPPRTDP